MNSRALQFLALLLLLTGLISACRHGDDDAGCGETKISSYDEDDSHNMGQNCMSCHSGGPGEGCFTAAGTVYFGSGNVHPGSTVRLYTGQNATGSLRYTLEVDENGNFYSTESINYSGGLYPSVTGTGGETEHMPDPITSGACNSCHGVSTERIEVE